MKTQKHYGGKNNEKNLLAINNLIQELSWRLEDPFLRSLEKGSILEGLYSDALFIKTALEGHQLDEQVLKSLENHINHLISIIYEDAYSPFFHLIGEIEEVLRIVEIGLQ